MAKRETNAQRSAREYERRTTLQMAKWVAEIICTRRENKADLAPEDSEDLPPKEMKMRGWHPESKDWRKTYTFLGQVFCEFCEFDENPAKFLRLVADRLEGKQPPYSAGDNWNDAAITKAYGEACRRRRVLQPIEKTQGGVVVIDIPYPSFSEFENVFLEQNPVSKLPKPPMNRSLRRSLKRLGYRTRPDKRGRPRKK